MKSQQKNQKPKFWQNVKAPILVAHRGGDAVGLEKENSLAAFTAAYKLGYRWFETDVVSTKDGVLLAIHGRGYQLKPNKDLPYRLALQRRSYAELKSNLLVGGEQLITLEELLDAFPDVRLFIDPKTNNSVKPLTSFLVNRPQDLNRVCIGSFSVRRTRTVKKSVEQETGTLIATALLGMPSGWLIYRAASFRILRGLARKYVRYQGVQSVHVTHTWARNRSFINYAHELGLKVAVYTPNRETDIQVALSSNVDVIMSDRVRLLRSLAS